MNFLAPWWVPAVAALAVIPPLVLLYFLKLKRREVRIPSTILWRKAVQDLQVNSPFQRLRNNLLLWLQLLVLLLAILAISEPMWRGQRSDGRLHVLLIDCSASMAAREPGGQTRLEIARDEARTFIGNMGKDDRAMVIAFADRARVLCAITQDRDRLRAAIDHVEQSDAVGRLHEAMQLAEAPSSEVGEGYRLEDDNPIKEGHYVLFTDGRLPDTERVRVQRGTLEIIRIGETTENSGIVNMDVRRAYEKPEQISVLARVRNFGARPVTRDVSLYVDGDLKGVQTLSELAPMAAADRLGRLTYRDQAPEESEATAAFELVLPTAGQIEVRLSGEDAMPGDDRAFAVVAPPRPMTALLITPGNRFLRQLMASLPLASYEIWTPDEYENAPEEKLIDAGRCRFDVVIFDGHSTGRLPPASYLFFAAVPQIEGVALGEKIEGQAFLDWDDTHPILRHVAIEAMTVFSWRQLTMPPEADTLIEASSGPILSLLRRERNQYLVCAFGLFDETRTYANTDWFFQEGFVVFGYNVVRYLTGSTTIGQQPPVSPGEAFTVAVRPGADSVSIRRPDGRVDTVAARGMGLVTYGQTDRIGIYTISDAVPGNEARAVNLLSEAESFVAPNDEFRIAAGEVTTGTSVERVNRPLWPFVLMALGTLLLLEWFIYARRVHV